MISNRPTPYCPPDASPKLRAQLAGFGCPSFRQDTACRGVSPGGQKARLSLLLGHAAMRRIC